MKSEQPTVALAVVLAKVGEDDPLAVNLVAASGWIIPAGDGLVDQQLCRGRVFGEIDVGTDSLASHAPTTLVVGVVDPQPLQHAVADELVGPLDAVSSSLRIR